MDADSTEEAPLSPLQIHISTSLPGSSVPVPIRAPLTIDSDSDYSLSINDQAHSRTTSFDSSFSIDISSVALEEDDTFVAYPNDEIVIETSHVEECSFTRPFVKYPDGNFKEYGSNFDNSTIFRPFVKYPDGNYVKESSEFDESAVFRPFVKYPDGNYVKESSDFDESSTFRPFVKIPSCEETGADLGSNLGVPVAHLTSDCDSDVGSADGRQWFGAGEILADGSVQKMDMVPTVRVFNEELQFEGVRSGDRINDINESNGVISGADLVETIEDAGQKVDCFNELMGVRSGDHINDIVESNGVINGTDLVETIEDSGQKLECLNEVVGVCYDGDINDTDKSNGVIDSTELLETNEGTEQKVEFLNEDVGSDSVELIEDGERKVERLNKVVNNLCELDELSFDSKEIDAQIVLDSNNEIEIGTINKNEGEVVVDCCKNESKEMLSENEEEMLVKLQPIRAKFLRLVRLLGLSIEDSIVMQLLHRLALGKQPTGNVDGEDGNDESDFYLTILAIGKTGVGKSATINSIFNEKRASTDAFRPATTTVKEIIGKVGGVQLRVFDTPGLKCCPSERSYNLRILSSIKRFTRKHAPDVVLYVDRLDTHTRDTSDSHLLRLITSSLGSSVWRNCIITLTHATSLETSGGFAFQRCRFIQEQIVSLGCSDRHMTSPVWLVENHPSYKLEKDWRTRLLLLCYSAKILHEANSMIKASLPSLESSRLFEFSDRLGHNIDIDLDLGYEKGLSCSNQANEDECDRVLPFERRSESQNAAKRRVECRKAYCFKEHDCRVKLLGKKHWSVVCRFYC